MTTDAKSGMKGSLWVCATQEGTYQKVAELTDLQLRIDAEEIEATHTDSGGWVTRSPERSSGRSCSNHQ